MYLYRGRYSNADSVLSSYNNNFNNSSHNLTMGFELEHSFLYDYSVITNLTEEDYCILTNRIASYEEDRSLRNGWEAVSYPFGINEWDDVMADLHEWFDLYLSKQSDDNEISLFHSGMHVHVNKTVLNLRITKLFELALSKDKISKTIHYRHIYNNYKKNNYVDSFLGLLLMLSRRNFAKYCNSYKLISNYFYDYCNSHYSFISCSHRYTIEYRIFKSCTNFDDFHMNLLFVRSIYDFGRKVIGENIYKPDEPCYAISLEDLGEEYSNFTYKNYLDYLCDNELYHPLVEKIIGRKKERFRKIINNKKKEETLCA